ncbi:MAG TPA: hypothetical protein VJU16_00850, partial [Planctomycetota bacterium]|nr:hypothetical protein [Planctomycetota bacterium]
MSRRFMPALVRATLIASLSGLMSLASCDFAGSDGGPGPSPGITGSLPPGPLPTPFTLDSVRATIGIAALESNSYSFYPSLSGNGRYVVFGSIADNLVSADLNGSYDVFMRDTQLGVTKILSV